MPPKRDDKPNAAAVNALRQWLRDHGVPSAAASQIVRTTRKMGEISDDLRQYLWTR